jgi:PRTRC genetic system protein A
MNETSKPLICYATTADLLPSSGSALTYYLAGNGIFVSAVRPSIQILMPICLSNQRIKGLPHLTPYLNVTPRIPKELLLKVWRSSCNACTESNVEILFHFHKQDTEWKLQTPEQTQNTNSCQPTESGSHASHHHAVAEIHSHAAMPAFFSSTDNADETGFRIYGVLGRVNTTKPEIQMRVGLFQHCWNIPAKTVFDIEPDFFMTDVSVLSGCQFYSTELPPANVLESLWS